MDEQTQQQAEALGKRIALLLAIAPITDEQRANLAASVPSMDGEQLIAFIAALEAKIPDGAIEDADTALAQEISKQQDAYGKKRDALFAKTHAALDDIEKELDDLNQE